MDRGNETTLQDLNDLFTKRNFGGIVFISLQMIIGCIGNFMVIWIYSRKFRATNFRTYTLWLASMDITNCCIGMPFLLVYHTHYLTFPSIAACKLGRFTMVFTANTSSFILVVIALDRYIHVCRPCNIRISKIERRFLIATAVLLSLGISWPALVLFGNHSVKTLPYNIVGTRCWEDDNFSTNNYISDFYIVQSAVSFVITVILFVAYSLIVRFIYKNKIVDKIAHTKKTTLILLAVTAAYVLSALPHNIFLVILFKIPLFHCHMTFIEGLVFYIFVWSILFNNSVNPFIYGFSDREFRKELKKTFKICFAKKVEEEEEKSKDYAISSSSNWT